MCQISSLMAAAEGLVAEFSSFANSEEKKRKSNLWKSFPKNRKPNGFFWSNKKKNRYFASVGDSRYSRIYALKMFFFLNSEFE